MSSVHSSCLYRRGPSPPTGRRGPSRASAGRRTGPGRQAPAPRRCGPEPGLGETGSRPWRAGPAGLRPLRTSSLERTSTARARRTSIWLAHANRIRPGVPSHWGCCRDTAVLTARAAAASTPARGPCQRAQGHGWCSRRRVTGPSARIFRLFLTRSLALPATRAASATAALALRPHSLGRDGAAGASQSTPTRLEVSLLANRPRERAGIQGSGRGPGASVRGVRGPAGPARATDADPDCRAAGATIGTMSSEGTAPCG